MLTFVEPAVQDADQSKHVQTIISVHKHDVQL